MDGYFMCLLAVLCGETTDWSHVFLTTDLLTVAVWSPPIGESKRAFTGASYLQIDRHFTRGKSRPIGHAALSRNDTRGIRSNGKTSAFPVKKLQKTSTGNRYDFLTIAICGEK